MEFQRYYLIDDDRTIIDGSDDLEDLRNLAESLVEQEGRLVDCLAIVEVVMETKSVITSWCECKRDGRTGDIYRMCALCASQSLRPLGHRSQ